MSSSANTDRKGGFVQGIPQISTLPVFSTLSTSGCCGSTDQPASSGCCGEPVTQTSGARSITVTQGCCGEPAVINTSPAQTGECCGEPTTTAGTASTVQSGCCN